LVAEVLLFFYVEGSLGTVPKLPRVPSVPSLVRVCIGGRWRLFEFNRSIVFSIFLSKKTFIKAKNKTLNNALEHITKVFKNKQKSLKKKKTKIKQHYNTKFTNYIYKYENKFT